VPHPRRQFREIIEFPCVLLELDDGGQLTEVDRFRRHVLPLIWPTLASADFRCGELPAQHPLAPSPFCTQLTGGCPIPRGFVSFSREARLFPR